MSTLFCHSSLSECNKNRSDFQMRFLFDLSNIICAYQVTISKLNYLKSSIQTIISSLQNCKQWKNKLSIILVHWDQLLIKRVPQALPQTLALIIIF